MIAFCRVRSGRVEKATARRYRKVPAFWGCLPRVEGPGGQATKNRWPAPRWVGLQPAQPLGCRFRRDVALRIGQEFITHQKLSYGCRTEERRMKVRVKVPLMVRGAIGRPLVK